MNSHIGVRRSPVKILAHQQYSFAVFRCARANELDIGGKGDISGNLLPNEVEVVARIPHIGPSAGDPVFARSRVELSFAPRRRSPDTSCLREEAQLRLEEMVACSQGTDHKETERVKNDLRGPDHKQLSSASAATCS